MSKPSESGPTYIAGFDLGAASLGWSAIEVANEAPRRLLDWGATVFKAGVTEKSAMERGADESRARERREARSGRRRIARRAARLDSLFQLLQSHHLLPATEPPRLGDDPRDPGQARERTIEALDRRLRDKWLKRIANPAESQRKAREQVADLLPYILRKHGLDERLELHELGRALMHLAQRRGFSANRMASDQDKDEQMEDGALREPTGNLSNRHQKAVDHKHQKGAVARGIDEISAEMQRANCRTLGELFSRLNPHETRIRARWTSREMYQQEFDLLWSKQLQFHDQALADLREPVEHKIFFQRPVTWSEDTIGLCQLETDPERLPSYTPEQRKALQRAPWCAPEAQRFRLVQRVNDLRIIPNFGALAEPLIPEQRELLKELLERKGDQSYAALRRHLQLPKTARFNFEPAKQNSRKTVPPVRGNRTLSVMHRFFGNQWNDFSPDERDMITTKWCDCQDVRELAKFGKQHYPELDAEKWAEQTPESGRCSLCLTAIRRLLPIMEQGVSYKEAEAQKYPQRRPKALDRLPPVRKAIPELRNPAVERSLTQLRKVVNAMIRKYGVKPQRIRIELARELRKSRGVREKLWEQNNAAAERRGDAVRRIFQVLQENNVTRTVRDAERLIEKVLLWEECGGICPYSGEQMSFSAMILQGHYQVEHILPKSRFPFKDFSNKTLCHPAANARKRNRIPWEAYHNDPDYPGQWEKILDSVRHFKGPWAEEKLRRFRMSTEEAQKFADDFTERQLNDTAYASVLAVKYLSTLYGGPVANGKRVVSVTSGGITKSLRDGWGLNSVLPSRLNRDEPASVDDLLDQPKNRGDHRHHAIDAVVIALTNDKQVKRLNDQAALNLERWGKEVYADLSEPWDEFRSELKKRIQDLVVSPRPEHKLQGKLHLETNYGPPRNENGKKAADGEFVHIRVEVAELLSEILGNKKQQSALEDIVDKRIRELVQAHIEPMRQYLNDFAHWKKKQSGKKSQWDWAGAPKRPVLTQTTRKGPIPIRRVRMRVSAKGRSAQLRHGFVQLQNNHHMVIVAELDGSGREKRWHGHIVPLFDAMDELSKTPKEKRRGTTVPKIIEKEFEFVVLINQYGKRKGKPFILPCREAQTKADAQQVAIVRGKQEAPLLRYKFYLMGGDIIELDGDTPGKRQLWVVRKFSQESTGRIGLVRINDARKTAAMSKNDYWRPMVNELFKRHCWPVVIDLLGSKHPLLLGERAQGAAAD